MGKIAKKENLKQKNKNEKISNFRQLLIEEQKKIVSEKSKNYGFEFLVKNIEEKNMLNRKRENSQVYLGDDNSTNMNTLNLLKEKTKNTKNVFKEKLQKKNLKDKIASLIL